MSSPKPLLSLDRVLVLIALGCALAALLRKPLELPTLPDLQPLRDELAILRRSVDEFTQSAPPLAVAAPVAAPAASQDQVTIRQLHEWVWQLDERLAQLARTNAQPNPLTVPFSDAAQARQTALNSSAAPQERLLALRALHTANAITPDVVQAMLELQAGSEDSKLRADLIKQLGGVADASLKPLLMATLQQDQSAKVREKAAEALSPFLADPAVRSALIAAAQNEPDAKAQNKMLEVIEGQRRK